MDKEMQECEIESHSNEDNNSEANSSFMTSEQQIHLQEEKISIEDHFKLFQEKMTEYVAKYNTILQYIILSIHNL